MDDTILQELRASNNIADKAAIVAEAVLSDLPTEIALTAHRCVILHWFDQSVIRALIQDISLIENTVEEVYEQFTLLPFTERLPWGLAFQDLTREGLLKRFVRTQPDFLRTAASFAIPAYEANMTDERSAAEALFCRIIAGDHKSSEVLLNVLLERAAGHKDWQRVANLLLIQDEAEHLPFVLPLPPTEQIWMLRGLVHKFQGDLDAAIADYSEAIKLNPKSMLAHVSRGTTYAEQQNYTKALAEYEQALNLDSNSVIAYCSKGAVLNEIGRYQEALSAFDQALLLEPDFADAHKGREDILHILRHYQGASVKSKQQVQLLEAGANKRIELERDPLQVTRLSNLAPVIAPSLQQVETNAALGLVIGRSEAMQKVATLVHRVAESTRASVLLQGESGTGKEVIARAIHALSSRAHDPFVAINCAAIPHALLETELFGVASGAYTDAKLTRDGYILSAHHGTLFLDEIAAMPLFLQAKLLRFLETLRFRRVGGTKELHVDVRIISATNVDLKTEVARKAFREDLFYRLEVITITLPPLRERPEDIEPLIEHFLKSYQTEDMSPLRVSPEAMDLLLRYSWPGNVRQLLHAITHGQILCDGRIILPKDLPEEIRNAGSSAVQRLQDVQEQIHLPPSA